jgi:hypothetical protein
MWEKVRKRLEEGKREGSRNMEGALGCKNFSFLLNS